MAPSFLLPKNPARKNKKAHLPVFLARGLQNSLIKLNLSPETPLARYARPPTRSATRAGTTHHLAAVPHQASGYFPGPPGVKGRPSQTL